MNNNNYFILKFLPLWQFINISCIHIIVHRKNVIHDFLFDYCKYVCIYYYKQILIHFILFKIIVRMIFKNNDFL